MYIYEAVKDMRVADVELTGSWEKTLAQVERHTLDTETFMQSILDYTRSNRRDPASGFSGDAGKGIHLPQVQDGKNHPPFQSGQVRP